MNRFALLLFCLVVAGMRLALVFFAGGPIPFHDQWPVEAQAVILPSFGHYLDVGYFFLPNNEHVIALTRLIALAIVKVEGRWDVITEMVINCVISPFCLVPLLAWTARNFSQRLLFSLLAVVGFLFGSPLFYGNVIWGFQSQILLMIAFSVTQIALLTATDLSPTKRALALACGLLAAISFGSGWLASLVLVPVLLLTRRDRSIRANAESLAACALVVALGLFFARHAASLGDTKLVNVIHTFIHALSWPDRFFSFWGFWFWTPFAVAAALALRDGAFFATIVFPFAAGLWGAAQAAAIAVARSEPAIVLAPRYYDIFAVGTLANLILLFVLRRHFARGPYRRLVTLALAGWIAIVGWKAFGFARSHTVGDVPVLAHHSVAQQNLIHDFYRGPRTPLSLESIPFPDRPFPDSKFLAEILKRPEVISLWPRAITADAAPPDLLEQRWPDRGPLRRTWFNLTVALSSLALLTLLTLAARSPVRTAPPPA